MIDGSTYLLRKHQYLTGSSKIVNQSSFQMWQLSLWLPVQSVIFVFNPLRTAWVSSVDDISIIADRRKCRTQGMTGRLRVNTMLFDWCLFTLSLPIILFERYFQQSAIRLMVKLSNYFYFFFQNSNFHCHIWIQHEKCIQKSTNKLSIGA